ncbi:MAG TPA: hypothetical protein VK395_16995 [Gemmataceae bacterium]|nr:hypothetical protein [Gemmataceae bacterium]
MIEQRSQPVNATNQATTVNPPRQRTLSADDQRWQLMIELGLPRPPQALQRPERNALLQKLLDLAETCRADPNWANNVRAVLLGILEDS